MQVSWNEWTQGNTVPQREARQHEKHDSLNCMMFAIRPGDGLRRSNGTGNLVSCGCSYLRDGINRPGRPRAGRGVAFSPSPTARIARAQAVVTELAAIEPTRTCTAIEHAEAQRARSGLL